MVLRKFDENAKPSPHLSLLHFVLHDEDFNLAIAKSKNCKQLLGRLVALFIKRGPRVILRYCDELILTSRSSTDLVLKVILDFIGGFQGENVIEAISERTEKGCVQVETVREAGNGEGAAEKREGE